MERRTDEKKERKKNSEKKEEEGRSETIEMDAEENSK